MITRFLLCLSFAFAIQPAVIAKDHTPTPDSITVYIFLHESCRISQYYTLPLIELHDEFANKHTQFVGIFPNTSSKIDNIEAFKVKYNIPFDLQTDYDKVKTEQFGATVTPEVIVYNETQQQILYKGRIDDAYARVGKRRQVTSTSELKDALTAIANNRPIKVTETEAIGCFISIPKPN